MAGRPYFLSVFTVVLLTAGLAYAVDPQAVIGVLVGIGKLLLGAGIIAVYFLLILAAAFLIGPVER